MEFDELYAEILNRDEKIIRLEATVCTLNQELDQLKNVVDLYIKRKCKRGERTAFNVHLMESVHTNLHDMEALGKISAFLNSDETMHEFLLRLLTGETNTNISLCTVDTNLIAYTDAQGIKLIPLRELSTLLRNMILPIFKRNLMRETSTPSEERDVIVMLKNKSPMAKLNLVTNQDQFHTLVKKCVKTYNSV